jgi:HK97 family phage prohead protease
MADFNKGDFVSWNSSGGRARGRIDQIKTSGVLTVPNTDFKINATQEEPAALITVYKEGAEGWKPTDIVVGHKVSTLTKIADLRKAQRAAVNLSPPEYMRTAARRGIKLHEEGKSGDGVVPQTIEDARKMASGTVTAEKWRKIAPWIARHLSDLDNVKEGEITAGVVAHLLWGSNGTKSGATKTMNYAQSVIDQLGERMYGNMNDQDERALPDNYRPANSEGVPAGAMCGTCISRNDDGMCMRFDAMCEADMYCNSYEPKVEEAMHEGYMMADTNDLEVCVEATVTIPASWVVAQQGNRSIVYSNMELRAMAEGNTLVGYAAVWDSPSEPLPWTEFVRRGAFTKTIKDGADVRLLIDHEGVPLARSKSGTLTMEEDDFGLRIEAMLDETNPDAAKVMSALRRGDVSQMSFAFQTVKDSWSTDKRTRELKEVRLYDVSVVTYPAYEETVAELRSRNNTTTDTVTPVAPLALRKRQIQLQQMQAES